MLLEDRTALVYGGGGTIGGAVARAFAREGARIFLVGRTPAALEAVAGEIDREGGRAETAQVDVLDEEAVERHAAAVVGETGRIDVSFTAISHGDVHGASLLDLSLDDFLRPVATAMRAHFLTARAAARHMVERGSGVIMAITATSARMSIPDIGGTGVAFDAVESLCRQWASELGPRGVRVAWLQTTGIPEALADVERFPAYGTGAPMTREELVAWNERRTMLGRLTTLKDVGDAAAFLASDRAGAITGSSLNLTLGFVPTR